MNSNIAKVPQSPDMAAIEKFTETPVEFSTGVPNISIPICVIQQDEISVPVSISYHNGGIIVGEAASYVGQNWALQAGGQISIIKNGLPDDHLNGYLNKYNIVYNAGTNDTFIENATYTADFVAGNLDTEPDFYSYSFAGYSGKFVIDPNKNVMMFPKSDLKVQLTWNGITLKGITIITPEGTRYHFGCTPSGNEQAYENSMVQGFPEKTAFLLTKIESANLTDFITFKYKSNDYTFRSPCTEMGYYDHCGVINFGPGNYNNCYRDLLVNTKILDSIVNSSNTSYVAFGLSTTNRLDLLGTSKSMKNITYSNGIECHKFELYQGYFKDPNETNFHGYRLKLDSLREFSCDLSLSKPSYKFTYEGSIGAGGYLIFPKTTSRSIDHWGYYNGQNNDNATINAMTFIGEPTFSSGQRHSNGLYMKYGSLKKINYPTGGSVEYEMEANTASYFDYQYTDLLYLLSCIPISPTACCAAPPKTGTFTFTNADQISKAVFVLKTNYIEPVCTDCYNTSNPPGATIELWRGSTLVGSTTYNLPNAICGTLAEHEFPLVSTYNDAALDENESIVPNVQYTFKLISGKGISEFILKSRNLVPNNKDVGGLRVKKITLDDGTGVNKIEKNYTYPDILSPSLSSGYLKWFPQYIFRTAYWPSTFLSQEAIFKNATPNSEFIISNPKLASHSLRQGHITYTHVIEKIIGNGRREMYFAVGNPITKLDLELPGSLLEGEGKMTKESIYSESNTLLSETTYSEYNTNIYEKFNFLIAKRLLAPTTICGSPQLGDMQPWPVFYELFTYHPYLLAKTKTITDGIELIDSSIYDTQLRIFKPIASFVRNSDNKLHSTEYQFPFNFTGNTAIDSLKSKNIKIPIITYKKVDNVIVDGNRTSFKLLSGFPYPDSVFRYEVTWNGGAIQTTGWDLQHRFDTYDLGVGKPSSITVKGWTPITYEYFASTGLLKKETFQSNVKQYQYHTGYGLISKVTDIDGQYIDFTYDKLGRLSSKLARPKIASPNWVAANYHQRSEYAYNYKGIGSTYNYTAQKMLLTPTTGSDHDTVETRQFYDGLGRPNYQIKMMSSPALKDVIVATEYDNRGRAHKVFQPFESTGSTGFPISIPVNTKFTSNTYEESPLNRVKTTTPPSWYASTFDYGSNTSGTEVPNLDLGGNFIANSLTKSTVTNPDGNKTIVYKDKLGKEILTWKTDPSNITGAKTYSLYDDKNRVKTIVPPGATTAQTDAIFQYTYDGNDNVLTKKVPSRGIANFKYNTKNQLTLSQEAHFATNNWLYSIYDLYGRVSNYGMIVQASPNPDNAYTFSDEFMNFTYFTNTTTDGVKFGKIKQQKDKILGSATWLEQNFDYDIYGRQSTISGSNFLYNNTSAESTTLTYDHANAIITQNRTHKQDATPANNSTINSRFTYDKQGRVIDYFVSLNGGSEQKLSNSNYNFRDELIEKNLGATSVGGVGSYLQSLDFTYNELGWLKTINQSSLVGVSSGLPSGVCSPSIPNQSAYTYAANPDPNDLFYMELNYDGIGYSATGLPTNLQKAGNIGLMAYRVKGRDIQAYNYTYDYLDRLTNSTHYNVSSTSGNASASNWYNENLTYDIRGNISTLSRQGFKSVPTCAYSTIDNLTYTYAANTNRLTAIADAANATYRPSGFNPNLLGSGYTYDTNGNLKTDSYKGITNIIYNHLNLPSKIEWSTTKSIDFVYSASGTKLAKTVKTGVTTNSIQHYLGGIEYNSASGSNRRVEAIYHAEGRFFNTNTGITTPTYRTEYTIKDHLGNARVTFADLNSNGKVDLTNSTTDNEIIQENHYYAFGMAHEGPWLMNNGAAKDNFYQYNSKEYNNDHALNWNDYGARWYDPVVGRFTTVDPLASMFSPTSPYVYTLNNPLKYIDPTGMATEESKAAEEDVDYEARYAESRAFRERVHGELGGGDPIVPVTDANKKNISLISWCETSGLYPTKTMKPSEKEKITPSSWDQELLEELLKARAAINLIATRNKKRHSDNPDLTDPVEKLLAAYHLTDNFPDVDSEIKDDNTVKYFYLSPNADAKTPSIDSRYWDQEKVKSYGPFYNAGGGDVPKGATYLHFYKAVKKTK
ncbi:MAG: RHS repeat-associated core domain-containing protein [Saprospiraceae bacterium]